MGASKFLSVTLWMCILSHGVSSSAPEVESPQLTPYYTGSCILCPSGSPGPLGPAGTQGISGRDGRDGRDGHGGACCNGEGDGLDGDDNDGDDNGGPSPPTHTFGGAVYVRWGRPECTSVSALIYSGIAAGGHYTHKGSGSNYLCMPEEPIYDEPQAGTGGSRAILYGAEYETSTFPNWADLHNSNVPCAVGWAPSRPSLLVLPARNICPSSNWTTEYAGYLAASYHNHEGRSEFVCMDRNAEAVPRSSHGIDGALFYVADMRCGTSGSGLACPPYVEGYEINCAVCTR